MAKEVSYYGGVRTDVLSLLEDIPTGNILEIGGGDFETVSALSDQDRRLWGTDIRSPAGGELDAFVLGSFTDGDVDRQIPDGAFSLIIANDVLEHVEDSEGFASAVARKLKPGGKLLLSVPNARQVRLAFAVLARGTFPRTDAGLFDRTHLRWFCRQDVESLFGGHGFRLLKGRASGRLVRPIYSRTVLGELLGLQNLFLFEKP